MGVKATAIGAVPDAVTVAVAMAAMAAKGVAVAAGMVWAAVGATKASTIDELSTFFGAGWHSRGAKVVEVVEEEVEAARPLNEYWQRSEIRRRSARK